MKSPLHSSLGMRLFLVGVAQLVVLLFVVISVGYLLHKGAPPPERGGECNRPPGHPGAQSGPPSGERPPTMGPGSAGGAPRKHKPITGPIVTFLSGGLLIVAIGSFATSRWILRPVKKLAQTAERLGSGDLSARTELVGSDEITRLGRVFDVMAERVEHLVQSEKELLRNVSHELRTPLARIRVMLDLASESEGGDLREHLVEVSSDLEELEGLVRDVLQVASAESQGGSRAAGFVLRPELVDVRELLVTSVERFRAAHPARVITLEAEEVGEARLDPTLLRRVVENLLSNADKYSPNGEAPIEVRLARKSQGFEFVVEDHGVGIAEADLSRVFEPFYRSERSRTRSAGGVGLGLTLARGIVLAHGGTLDLESQLDRGTRAITSFPTSVT